MASRSRSARPLWRACSSTRCCHIHRTEMACSRKVKVSFSVAPSSAASTAGIRPGSAVVLLGGGWVCLLEVGVRGIGAVVQVMYLVISEGLPDRPALSVAQVPDQAEQGQVRWRHGAGPTAWHPARAFAKQGGPLPVEPGGEHLLLGFVAARRVILRTLDAGCDPGRLREPMPFVGGQGVAACRGAPFAYACHTSRARVAGPG